jgi:hypothetical protein
MRSILVILLFYSKIFAFETYELLCDDELISISEKIAHSQIGVVESGNNSGDVEKYLSSVGLPEGNPYCAAGQYWCFLKAANELRISTIDIPFPRSGLANTLHYHAKLYGEKRLITELKDSFLIWRRSKSKFGHIERIIKQGKAGWVITIAFNVKFKIDGRYFEGVSYKRRNIHHPLGRMYLRSIVKMRGI